MGVPLSPDTRSRLDLLFPPEHRQAAERLLREACGTNLPFLDKLDAKGLERFRFAALKVSGGSLERLLEAVWQAQVDWRDLLVEAGFAEDVQAHERWLPYTERMPEDPLVIAGRAFRSRLLLGTGKFPSVAAMKAAIEASGAEIVTVALRRVDLDRPEEPLLKAIPPSVLLLPNTSGAQDAAEAVRLAKLARAAGLPDWIKLEVTPDPRTLLPDPVETLKAAEILVKEGFKVLPYIHADPILAKRLQDAGTVTVMPLGSPIGTAKGIRTRDSIAIIIEQATVPVVVDAGLGAPSHAAEALEMGADAVLVNTAIAVAEDPAAMAEAFRLGVEAGRMAYRAGLAPERERAEASSPLKGTLERRA